MSNARNLSKFKPSSSGLVETADIADDAINADKIADNAVTTDRIADDAVTTAKVNPAQTDITSVGTLTGLTVGDNAGGDVNLTTNSQAGTQASPLNMDINFKGYNNNTMAIIRSHDESSSTGHGELQFHTTKAGVGTTEKMNIDHDGNVSIRNASTTGPTVNIGTTSTSVADGGYIGGILFDASTANTGTARIQALSNGQTDAGNTGTGADFSFECRDNNQSLTEKARLHGAGQFTVNSQPFCHVGRQGTTGSTNGYTDATGGLTFIFNIEQDDTGGHYNNSTGEFTCPVTGQYFISFWGFLHSGDSSSNRIVTFRVNSNDMVFNYFGYVNGVNLGVGYSAIVRCSATNIITIRANAGRWYSGDWRYLGMNIYLLG
jgi:hypothetical protein